LISCVSAFVAVSLQTLHSPRWRVRPHCSLTLTLSLSRFVPEYYLSQMRKERECGWWSLCGDQRFFDPIMALLPRRDPRATSMIKLPFAGTLFGLNRAG
jgi:hypothetical protein